MTISMPESVPIPQTGLAGLLGGGLGQGFAGAMEQKVKLAHALELAREKKDITLYQKLSSALREKEQSRKIQNSVTSELMKIADSPGGGIKVSDVPFVSQKTTEKIMGGTEPQMAISESLNDYKAQQGKLGELKIPRYNASKSKEQLSQINDVLAQNDITDPNLINRHLEVQKYPWSERQKILKKMQSSRKGVQETPPQEKKKLTSKLIDSFLKKANNDPDKALELAKNAGYEVE